MRMHLNGRQFDEVMLERFDELLGREEDPDMSDEEVSELNALSEWYDGFMDYYCTCFQLESFYREQGVEIVYD